MKKRTHHKLAYQISAIVLCLMAAPGAVYAGDINGNEAAVISAAQGTFSYNGKTYRAGSEYIAALQSKLAADGVDLTAEQAQTAIATINGNVAAGVEQGYLYEVGGGDGGNDTTMTEQPVTQPAEEQQPAAEEQQPVTATESSGAEAQQEISASTAENAASNANASGSLEESSKMEESSVSEEKQEKTEQKTIAEKKNKNTPSTKPIKKQKKQTKMIPLILTLVAAAFLGTVIWLWSKRQKKCQNQAAGILQRFREQGYTDLHCHILPEIDDGAKSMEQSLQMLDMAYENGIRKIILTPHYKPHRLRYDEERLQRQYQKLQEAEKTRHSDMELYLGNELYYEEEIVDALKQGNAHTMADSKYILIEFPLGISYSELYAALRRIVQARFYPILAHLERYACLRDRLDRLDELENLGVFFQMNAGSAIKKGAEGKRKWCRKLLKKQRIHFIATDAHNTTQRKPELETAFLWICAHTRFEYAQKLIIQNPKAVLENKYIQRG